MFTGHFLIYKHIEAQSCIRTSDNEVITGSGNGLVPYRHQAITCTNDDFVKWILWTNISEILTWAENSVSKLFEYVVCKMVYNYCSGFNVLNLKDLGDL